MDCEEFLSDYSDFLDRRFEVHSLSNYCQHLLDCSGCAEYDRVMRRGLNLVRQLDPPNADCLTRLESELGHRPGRVHGTELGRAGGLAAAAAGAFLTAAAMLLLAPGRGTVDLPPVVVETPESNSELPSLFGPAPRLSPAASVIEIPQLGAEPFFSRPTEPLSLFRAPLRSQEQSETAEAPED